jgi:acyl-CoA synthetase (AMP-forming)/AMP-acid ligase II
MDMYDPEKEFQLIQDEKVTILGGVPTHYAMRLRVTDPERFDLSSLRLAFVSGAPCPLEILTSVKRQFGLRMQNGYGLTEVSGAITSITPDDDDEKREVTVGRPLPGVDLAIMDSANSVLPPGQIGEIVVKGDVVMKGYWNRPDEDKKVFDEKGYLHTGDIGKLDEDGYLVIVGRKKEMFIRGGENVYPPEIENTIAQHPDVFMVAVVGRPDPLMGEVGRAYIIPKPGKNLTADDMKAFLKNRLSKYKTPADYIFRDQLPLSPLGKVQKLELYKEMKQEFEKKQ